MEANHAKLRKKTKKHTFGSGNLEFGVSGSEVILRWCLWHYQQNLLN